MSKFSKRSAGAPMFEPLEGRTMLSATTVYVESNNSNPGQNAVIALHRNPADGSLREIGTFLTGGTGQANPTQGLGPDDSDQEVIASPNGRFLFAVNQGSDSVAVFRIRHSGRLSLVGTFDSGGTQPVSLGFADGRLYVTNRGNAFQGTTATIAPNYTGFNVNEDGSLTPIPGSTVTLPLGLSPAQTLISADGKFVFGDNFAIPTNPTPSLGNTIDPFQIAPNGTLVAAPGGPVGPSPSTTLLGLAAHPTERIVYGGLTGAAEVGVFTYDATGKLTFVRAVADQGKAVCWIVVSPDGKYMYVANTGSNTIGVYSLADPLNPVEVQDFKVTLPQPPAGATTPPTAVFQLALDPSGKSLYVISQSTAANHDFPQGNAVHALSVADDGTLSETNPAVTFSTTEVPATARIQGVAVVQTASGNDDGFGNHDADRR
jgi:hypothetical protein